MSDELKTRLERFLAREIPDAREIVVRDCQPLSGGYSCIMTKFTAVVDGVPRHYVSRADQPLGRQVTVGSDRDQEWALARALMQAGAPVPRAEFYDADGAAMGTKTMILEFIDGPSLLAEMRGTGDESRQAQADLLCDMAAACHAVDVNALPSSMQRPADWESYFASCVEDWRRVEAEYSESMPVFRHLAAWLERHPPPPAPLTLVHGEFQPSNIMAGTASTPAVVVDWELAHIGDPREDLGYVKFIGATLQPPDLVGHDEESFCRRYRERTGFDETLINPHTLDYFMILPLARLVRVLSHGLNAFLSGATSSLIMPYMNHGFLGTAQSTWLRTTRALDALRRLHSVR